MTEQAVAPGPDDSYALNYEFDGTSFAVRENLADILERELLGPKFGPEEVLPFSPHSQYLVGLIAPVKLTGRTLEAGDVNAESAGESGARRRFVRHGAARRSGELGRRDRGRFRRRRSR